MKRIKQIIIFIICTSCCIAANAQFFDTMPVAKRDSLLISLAKEVVLLYGPDYYREYPSPTITSGKFPYDERYLGKPYYLVTFLYDKTIEKLEWNHAAKVRIFADTGEPASVFFGNGIGFGFFAEFSDWRKGTPNPIPYYDATRPIYIYMDKNADPVNKEELIEKGWIRQDNGQWRRTRPDVPPHRRVNK